MSVLGEGDSGCVAYTIEQLRALTSQAEEFCGVEVDVRHSLPGGGPMPNGAVYFEVLVPARATPIAKGLVMENGNVALESAL